MSYDTPIDESGDDGMPSSILFNNDMLRWPSQHYSNNALDYHQHHHHTTNPHQTSATGSIDMNMAPLQAVVPPPPPPSSTNTNLIGTNTAIVQTDNAGISLPTNSFTSPNASTPAPAINTTNPALAPPPPILDPTKLYHPEWGVIKDQDFHPLTLKHQRDLENLYQTGSAIADFYFWQANLGGYCMADMVQGIVVSTEGAFVLERKIVEGAPHPGRRKKKRGLG